MTEILDNIHMNNYNEVGVHVYSKLHPDGAGDFSTISKLIIFLIEKGFDHNKIYLYIDASRRNLSKISIVRDNITILKSAIVKNPDVPPDSHTKKYITLTNYGYRKINDLLIYICKLMDFFYQTPDGPICSDKKSTIQTKINVEQYEDSYIDNIYLNFVLLMDINDNYVKDPVMHNEDYVTDDEKIHCYVESTIIHHFFVIFYKNNFFSIWLKNIIRFFLSSPLVTNVYFLEKSIKKKTTIPAEYETLYMNKFNLSIAYLTNVPKYDILNDPSKNATIILGEGGDCDQTDVYSSGTSDKSSSCLGINILDSQIMIRYNIFDKIKQYLGIYRDDSPYYMFYFGQMSNPMYIFYFFYKLQKIFEILMTPIYNPKTSSQILIYINYDPFDVLLGFEYLLDIFNNAVNITKNSSHIIFTYSECTITLTYYNVIPCKYFIDFLFQSEDICVLTCDQSYFEGITMGKKVIYDVLSHKIILFFNMMKTLLKIASDIYSKTVSTEAAKSLIDRYDAEIAALHDNAELHKIYDKLLILLKSYSSDIKHYYLHYANIFYNLNDSIVYLGYKITKKKLSETAFKIDMKIQLYNIKTKKQNVKTITYLDNDGKYIVIDNVTVNLQMFNEFTKVSIQVFNLLHKSPAFWSEVMTIIKKEYDFNKNFLNLIDKKLGRIL